MASTSNLGAVEPGPTIILTSDIPTCAVCFEVYHTTRRPPKMFPCGHTFCLPCVINLCFSAPNVQLRRGVPCATCRKVAPIRCFARPQDSFPTNFSIRELAEKYEEVQENQKYHCMNCKNLYHERELTLCNTCLTTGLFHVSERDFLKRPSDKSMCENCASIHHKDHVFMPFKTVLGRWKHRELFERFLKTADDQRTHIDDLFDTLKKGLTTANNYKTNFDETVNQIMENAGRDDIEVMVQNFIKAGNTSAFFFDTIRESVGRLSKPREPHFQMLGANLFKKGSETVTYRSYLSNTYKQKLRNMFAAGQWTRHGRSNDIDVVADRSASLYAGPRQRRVRNDFDDARAPFPLDGQVAAPRPAPDVEIIPPPWRRRPRLIPRRFLEEDELPRRRNVIAERVVVPEQVGLPQRAEFPQQVVMEQNIPEEVVPPPVFNRNRDNLDDYNMILQVQPALFEQVANNVAPLELPPLFQPVAPPPVPALNADHLNVVMQYFLNIQVQQRNQYLQAMNFNDHLGFEQFEDARRRAVDAAFIAQAGFPPAPEPLIRPAPERIRIQNYFALPFHLFNAHLPLLYHETLGNVIQNFVDSVQPVNRRNEAYDYFFVPPYDDFLFSAEGYVSIKAVLQSLLLALIPGQFPYTSFEAMIRAIDAVEHPPPVVAPIVIVLDDDDNVNNADNNRQLVLQEVLGRNRRVVEVVEIFQEMEEPAQEVEEIFQEMEEPAQEVEEIFQEMEEPAQEVEEIFQEMEEPAQEVEEMVQVVEEPAQEVEEMVQVVEELAQEVEEIVQEVFEENVREVEEDVQIVEDPVQVVEEVVEILEEPVQIVENPVQVVEEVVEILEEPVQIVEDPVQVVGELVEILEEPAQIVGDPVQVVGELVEIIEEPIQEEQPPLEELLQREEPIVLREGEEDQEREVEPNDEFLSEMRRRGRQNYVFQMEDLVLEPPARATRAAKRRAVITADGTPGDSLAVAARAANTPSTDSTNDSQPLRRGRPRKRKLPTELVNDQFAFDVDQGPLALLGPVRVDGFLDPGVPAEPRREDVGAAQEQPAEPVAPQPEVAAEAAPADQTAPAPVDDEPILTPAGAEMKGLSCLICYDPFNTTNRIPKVFACGHTFCFVCIKELLQNRSIWVSSISCPTCRQPTRFTATSDPTKVSTNFSILSMLEQREEEKKGPNAGAEELQCYECQKSFCGKELTLCNNEQCQPKTDMDLSRDVDSIKRVKSLLICRDCINEKHSRHNTVPFEKVVAQYEANDKIIEAEDVLQKALKVADDTLIQFGLVQSEILDHRRRMVNAMHNIRDEANHPNIYDYLNRFKESVEGSCSILKRVTADLNTFDRQSKARYYRTFGIDVLRPISRAPTTTDCMLRIPKQEPAANSQRVRRVVDNPLGLRNAQNRPVGGAGDMMAAFLPFEFGNVEREIERFVRAEEMRDDIFRDLIAPFPRAGNRPAAANAAAAANAPAAANDPAAANAPAADAPAADAPAANDPLHAPLPARIPPPPVPPGAQLMDIIGGPRAFGLGGFGLAGFGGLGRRRRDNQRNMREVHHELQLALVEHPFMGDIPAVRNALAALEQVRDARDDLNPIWAPRPLPRRRRDMPGAPPLNAEIDRQLLDAEQRIDLLRVQIERLNRAARGGRRGRRRGGDGAGDAPWVDQVIEQPLPPRVIEPGIGADADQKEELEALAARIRLMVRNEAHAEAAIAGVPVPDHIEMPILLNPNAAPGVPHIEDILPHQVQPFLAQLRALELEWIQRGRDRRARAAPVPPEPTVPATAEPSTGDAEQPGNTVPVTKRSVAVGPSTSADGNVQDSDDQEGSSGTNQESRQRDASPSTKGPPTKKKRTE